jgi:hypothetical protein
VEFAEFVESANVAGFVGVVSAGDDVGGVVVGGVGVVVLWAEWEVFAGK